MRAPSLFSAIAAMLAPAVAVAGPVGNITPGPEQGPLAVSLFLDQETTTLRDSACDDSASGGSGGVSVVCEGRRSAFFTGIRLELRPLDFIGIYADLSHMQETISAAAYRGSGWSEAVGLRLAVHVTDTWRLGAAVHYGLGTAHQGTGTSAATTDETTDEATDELVTGLEQASEGAWHGLRITAQAVWAPGDGGLAFYAGPTWQPVFHHEAHLQADDLDYIFVLPEALGAVLGMELHSEPLGLVWSGRPGMLTLGLEARHEGGAGGGIWLRYAR